MKSSKSLIKRPSTEIIRSDDSSEDSSLSVNTSVREFKKSPLKTKSVPRKLIVKRAHVLQKIFKNRNIPRSEYWFTDGSKVNEQNQRDVSKETTPFMYRADPHLFSYKVSVYGFSSIVHK